MMYSTAGLIWQKITSAQVGIEWLRQASRSDFTEEIEYLRRLRDSVEVLEVYRQVFPGQFTASTASLFDPDHEWPDYTAREGEFLRLLGRLEWLPVREADEWEYFAERYRGIPVIPIQYSQWCCGDFEIDDLPPCYYLGYCVLNEYWDGPRERYDLKESDLNFGSKIDFMRFDQKLSREPDALRLLPAITDLMSYRTGNPFLDSSSCNPPDYYEWTAKNLKRLGTEYKRANYLLRAVWSLDDLIEADPAAVYRRVRDLWNQSQQVNDKDDYTIQN
jgi:hypothetical protein